MWGKISGDTSNATVWSTLLLSQQSAVNEHRDNEKPGMMISVMKYLGAQKVKTI